jgi:hypothetical protein
LPSDEKGLLMKAVPLKQAWPLFLVVSALSLMLAQPLWAAEETPTSQGKQEESFFQGIKRNLDEWLGRDNSADKDRKEAPKPTEQKPQAPATKKPDGRKVIDTFKKRMNKVSDNVSESVERDKKTLKKKLDKLSDDK